MQRAAWNHTAMVCATLANIHRRPGSAAIDPRVFHPMEKDTAGGAAIDVDAETVGAIGKMFAGMSEEYG